MSASSSIRTQSGIVPSLPFDEREDEFLSDEDSVWTYLEELDEAAPSDDAPAPPSANS